MWVLQTAITSLHPELGVTASLDFAASPSKECGRIYWLQCSVCAGSCTQTGRISREERATGTEKLCTSAGTATLEHQGLQELLSPPFSGGCFPSPSPGHHLGISCFRASLANAEGQGETLLPGLIQICNNLGLISINSAEIAESDPFISQGRGNEERPAPGWLNSSFPTKRGDDLSTAHACKIKSQHVQLPFCNISVNTWVSLYTGASEGSQSPAVQLFAEGAASCVLTISFY